MAFALNLLGTAANVSGQQTQNIGAFTPSANSEVYCVGGAVLGSTPAVPTVSDGLGSTYTAITTTSGAFNTSNRIRVVHTPIGSSPASMTPQYDWGATQTNCGLIIFEVTGLNTGIPVVSGSNIGTSGGSDATPAAGAAPALATSTNLQILVMQARRSTANSTAKVSPAWTKLAGVAGTNNEIAVFYIIGNYDSAPTCTLGGAALWYAGAFEVAIATGATTWGPQLSHSLNHLVLP